MAYQIVSFDANHNVNVRYAIGSIKKSQLESITAGTRTDSGGNSWNIRANSGASGGGRWQFDISTASFEQFLPSVGLGSLDIAYSFRDTFATVANYYLQKNQTTTVSYPNLSLTMSQSSSGGVTYTTKQLCPKSNSNTPNTIAVTITERSDSASQGWEYILCPLLVLNDNDEPVYMACFGGTRNNSRNTAQMYLSWNTNFLASQFSPVLTIQNNNEPLGGDPSFEFTGDDIELPSAPDETVSGVLASGFLNIYSPTASQLSAFGGALWTNAFNVKWYDIDSVSNLLLNTISDPINFIIGLFILPVTPTVGNASGIYLGGLNVNTVTANRITKQYVTIDFGTITIAELYGNYLDYAYSKLSIYLPYIGMADIDVQEVTGGSVTLQYIIDCFTGACVANVKCVKSTKTPWGVTYQNKSVHSYSGNVAIQLPISAGSFDTMTQGLINVGLGLVSGQPQTVAKGATDVITNVGGDATTRGSLSSNTGRICYQTPYLMFTHPIETRPAHLNDVHGVSAGAGGQLKNFSGLVFCDDVNLTGVTATDTEINMIESILKSGVYV